MTEVIWTSVALSDVLAIKTYIAAFNPAAAKHLAAELVAADSLATFPERGRPGLEEGTRVLPLRPTPP